MDKQIINWFCYFENIVQLLDSIFKYKIWSFVLSNISLFNTTLNCRKIYLFRCHQWKLKTTKYKPQNFQSNSSMWISLIQSLLRPYMSTMTLWSHKALYLERFYSFNISTTCRDIWDSLRYISSLTILSYTSKWCSRIEAKDERGVWKCERMAQPVKSQRWKNEILGNRHHLKEVTATLVIDGVTIEAVKQMKYLGIVIDDKLNFKIVCKKVGLLANLAKFLTFGAKY